MEGCMPKYKSYCKENNIYLTHKAVWKKIAKINFGGNIPKVEVCVIRHVFNKEVKKRI